MSPLNRLFQVTKIFLGFSPQSHRSSLSTNPGKMDVRGQGCESLLLEVCLCAVAMRVHQQPCGGKLQKCFATLLWRLRAGLHGSLGLLAAPALCQSQQLALFTSRGYNAWPTKAFTFPQYSSCPCLSQSPNSLFLLWVMLDHGPP